MNKIILSLLLISIAFVAMGAATAADVNDLGSHRPQLAVSDNVVSDLEGPHIISSDREFDLGSHRHQLGVNDDAVVYDSGSHRHQLGVNDDAVVYDVERPNIISSPHIISSSSEGSSFVAGFGPDYRPHCPGVNFDIHDNPVNPIGPKGPILQ